MGDVGDVVGDVGDVGEEPDIYEIAGSSYRLRNFQPSNASFKDEIDEMLNEENVYPFADDFDLSGVDSQILSEILSIMSYNETELIFMILHRETTYLVYQLSNLQLLLVGEDGDAINEEETLYNTGISELNENEGEPVQMYVLYNSV